MEILRFFISLPDLVFLFGVPLCLALLFTVLRSFFKWATWEIPDIPNKIWRFKNRKIIQQIRATSSRDPKTFVSFVKD